MPLGFGFWYDRRKRKWHLIREHATDAVDNPRRFRSLKIAHLNPVADREIIVRYVARQGFIRVRHWKQQLGFEFHGEPESALVVLKRYIRKHDVGHFVEVNFSDFAGGWSVLVTVANIMAAKSCDDFKPRKTKGSR